MADNYKTRDFLATLFFFAALFSAWEHDRNRLRKP